jgi:hypothetical protein
MQFFSGSAASKIGEYRNLRQVTRRLDVLHRAEMMK